MHLLLLAAAFAASPEPLLIAPVRPYGTGEVDPALLAEVEDALGDTLTASGMLVLHPVHVRPIVRDLLDACPPADDTACLRTALQTLPPRLGLQARVSTAPIAELTLIFVHEAEREPVREVVVPMPADHARSVTARVSVAIHDLVDALPPILPALAEAAGRLRAAPPVEDLPPPDEPLTIQVHGEYTDPEEPLPEDPPAPVERPPVVAMPPEPDLPKRLILGSRRAYQNRANTPAAWYRAASPHAGRVIVELRGGLGHADVHRETVSLGVSDNNGGLTSIFYEEGPGLGVGGRFDGYLGFAPVTFFEFGLGGGFVGAADRVTLGYMEPDTAPNVGEPFTVHRLRGFLQPRARFYLAPTGPVKPYVAVGAEFTFIQTWAFTVSTGEPFARPPRAMMPSVLGAVGLCFDAHPRVGIVLDGGMLYHLGAASRVRVGGTLTGDPPVPPEGQGFTVAVGLGLQMRL